MLQYQIMYEGAAALSDSLRRIAGECGTVPGAVLFKIYSDFIDTSIMDGIIDVVNESFPQAVIAGCSTNANIYNGHKCDADIILQCVIFEEPDTRVDVIKCECSGKSAEDILDELKSIYSKRQWVTGVEFLFAMRALSYKQIHDAFRMLKTDKLEVFGGGAYNKNMDGDESFVCTGEKDYSGDGLVAIFYGGSNLHIKTIDIAGWKPLGGRYRITSSEDNLMHEIDNRPAFEIYSRYLNLKNDKYFNVNSMAFPFLCSGDNGMEMLRTPVSATPDNTIVMFSRVDNFKYVRLTYGDPDTILSSVREGAEKIEAFAPDMISLFSCVARKGFWGNAIDKETQLFQDIAPTVGFFTSGEVHNKNNKMHLHNETMIVVAFREGEIKSGERAVVIADELNEGEVPLISRLVNFIGVATKELEEARNEADRANMAKTEFLANMSHEIRTPMNAIIGFNTMIMRNSKDKEISSLAMDINRAGCNLMNIINDILDLSKVESGKMELVPVNYEFISLITDVKNIVALKAEEKGLELIFDIAADIPRVMHGDDIRIKQIMVNILNNALKYTNTGSVTLKAYCTRVENTASLTVEIIDTGIGIRDEERSKLFEKFSRIDEVRNRQIEGTGLGMSITLHFLSLMNSRLNVDSEYGKGSKFSFTLCQEIVDDTPVGDVSIVLKNQNVDYEYSNCFRAPDATVLIVDDNEVNLRVIAGLLAPTELKLDTAVSGMECLERTRTQHYDLILMDHMMPEMDGIVTLKRLRSDERSLCRETPVIVLTANALVGMKDNYIKEGFISVITKPVDPNSLEQSIQEFIPKEKIAGSGAAEAVEKEAEKNEEEKPAKSALPPITGIDYKYAGLHLKNEKMIKMTLQLVVKNAEKDTQALKEKYDYLVANADNEEVREAAYYDYRVLIHGIKTQMATIGATALQGLALCMETAAGKYDLGRIEALEAIFTEDYLAQAKRIAEALNL